MKEEGLDYCWQGFYIAWQVTQNFFKELHQKKEAKKRERKQKQAKKEAVPMPISVKQKLKTLENQPFSPPRVDTNSPFNLFSKLNQVN